MTELLRPSFRRTRVLLVEDDADTREVVAMLLDEYGFQAACAADGLEALRAVEEFHPDVILLDLRMPEHDGFFFMRSYDGPVPIVVLTAWHAPSRQEWPLCPFAIVLKPAGVRDIAGLLQRAAESWRH